MKFILIVVATVFLSVLAGYKYFTHKFIVYQENLYKQEVDFKEPPRFFPDSTKMSDTEFWALIDKSKEEHPNHFNHQMEALKLHLSKLPNEKIVQFEKTLREKIIELLHHDIKSLYQIIYGDYISTDEFLYFRFWIISNGSKYFETALTSTDDLAEITEYNEDGESLMRIADEAFALKNGENSKLVFPRDQSGMVDYDLGNYKMAGTYTELKDFKNKFPKLSKKFSSFFN
jgi:hypothetical protein